MDRRANGWGSVSADAGVAICVDGSKTAARRVATPAAWILEAAADGPVRLKPRLLSPMLPRLRTISGQMFGAAQIGRDRIDINDNEIAMLDNIVKHEIELLGNDARQRGAHRRVKRRVI
jgi:hypothetical protein